MKMSRKILLIASTVLLCAPGLTLQAWSAQSAAAPVDATLSRVIASPLRPARDRARDGNRHPQESLLFWGLRPGITVVELQPEGGYWTEILAPYAAQSGGTYIGGMADRDDPDLPEGLKADRDRFEKAHADPVRYGPMHYVAFGAKSGPLAPENSVDLILSAREIHNWIALGFFDKALRDCYLALKPGGIFAVEEHRADPTKTYTNLRGSSITGYVPTQTVVDAAIKAGFELVAASEINANPKDTKDYPFGVWTLAPARLSELPGHPALTDDERAKYDAIGESDRMTLRFRKPK
jgi:predicted methyltransferase